MVVGGSTAGRRGLRGHSSTGTISKVTTKLQPAHYQVQQLGVGTAENPGEAGQREESPRQREEEQAR